MRDHLQEITSIHLDQIRPNPHNPRKTFSGQKFDDLVASIREKGVISPIMVRKKAKGKTEYEIIYGERRFRAVTIVANDYAQGGFIRAIIVAMTDDEAFDLMTI